MEVGNEEIKIEGMGDHLARLAPEITNYPPAQDQRFLGGEHVTTLSEGLGRWSDLSCRSRRHGLCLVLETSPRRAASRISR